MMNIIERKTPLNEIQSSLKLNPVTAILGPRQSGKTTLAREIFKTWKGKEKHFFDLENPEDINQLENPIQVLPNLKGLVILDEIQKKLDLFPYLRVLSDRSPKPARFLLLGSASGDLLKQTSESLAGRIGFIELPGFLLEEVDKENLNKHWLRGSYPRSFLAKSELESYTWRQNFISTFLERDIPNLGIRIPSQNIRRFWQMAAHYHGQIWNNQEIGRSLGQNDKTIKKYLDILTDTFMVRQLPAWFNNMGKRIVKSPKFYFRDTGLLHTLLGLKIKNELLKHPKLGASWEGYALEQVILKTPDSKNCFFWATHSGAVLDLLVIHKGKKIGFEFKYSGNPQITKSIRSAFDTLELDKLFIIHPGEKSYKIEKKIEARTLPMGLEVF